MDMDIDDILAELDGDNANHDVEDLRSLTRLWVAERVSPELVPWPEDLINRVMDRTAKQVFALDAAAFLCVNG
jgi:GINS complex subunit 4